MISVTDQQRREELAQHFAASINIEDEDLPELESTQHGRVICRRTDSGQWEFWALRKAGLSAEDAQGFDEWARQRAYMLSLTGDVEADGWFWHEEAQAWAITARVQYDMPGLE